MRVAVLIAIILQLIEALKGQFESPPRSPAQFVVWFNKTAQITKAIMESVTLVLVVILLNQYVIGSQAIFNTTASTIAATVVPILQAALLIAAIFAAIAIIYYAATHSFSTGGGKEK